MATARRRRKAEGPDLLPAGVLLLRLVLAERAVPWSASKVTRNGTYKDRRLVVWQRIVRLHAAIERVRTGVPYDGPVSVIVSASFARGPIPDATNILKAIEDALQGVIFRNDRQVMRNGCERYRGEHDMVTIEVRAAGDGREE